MVSNLSNKGLLMDHRHVEGLCKHGYIVFSMKKWITFVVHE